MKPPDSKMMITEAATQLKKRPNTDSHSGKRSCGERSARAGRRQKCAKTIPPTHTATPSKCKKSASSTALVMLFSSLSMMGVPLVGGQAGALNDAVHSLVRRG